MKDEIAKAEGDKPLPLLLRRADGGTSYALSPQCRIETAIHLIPEQPKG
jgi:hypothetical protein